MKVIMFFDQMIYKLSDILCSFICTGFSNLIIYNDIA